jgi:hypothetical protein
MFNRTHCREEESTIVLKKAEDSLSPPKERGHVQPWLIDLKNFLVDAPLLSRHQCREPVL